MPYKYQETGLNRSFGRALIRLEAWSDNPWRRYSLFIIIFLSAFIFGSSVGMLGGALALMDPVGAFFTVALIELTVRIRRIFLNQRSRVLLLNILDIARMGFLYGLFLEAFKLLF